MSSLNRHSDRISHNVLVDYVGFERFHPDRTLNLSVGGVFVLTGKPLPVGRKFRLRIDLPELMTTIQTEGSVIWSPNRSTPGAGARHPKGMGIAFELADQEQQHLLDQYVQVQNGLRSLDKRIGDEIPAHAKKRKRESSKDTITINISESE